MKPRASIQDLIAKFSSDGLVISNVSLFLIVRICLFVCLSKHQLVFTSEKKTSLKVKVQDMRAEIFLTLYLTYFCLFSCCISLVRIWPSHPIFSLWGNGSMQARMQNFFFRKGLKFLTSIFTLFGLQSMVVSQKPKVR